MSLTDAYGRKMEYLRISLTDKCNLRCRYCMPREGMKRLRHEDILTLEEVYRIAAVLTEMGICRIRLTGGEPLVRKGIDGLVEKLGALPGRPELALTTNGVLLEDHLEEFWAAGLRQVNISLDTLDPAVYRDLTGTDRLTEAERALEKAMQMGFSVKLNAVPIRGINEGELIHLAEYARNNRVDVRFIELMPIGCARDFQGINSGDILKMLEAEFGPAETADSEEVVTSVKNPAMLGDERQNAAMPEKDEFSGNKGPARYVRFRGFAGRVGFISPMSDAFCRDCNRLRLTVDGKLKLCLYYPDGPDLLGLLRQGISDGELKNVIRTAVLQKPEKHYFTGTGSAKEKRSMFEIGG